MARFQLATLGAMLAWRFAMGFQSSEWGAAAQKHSFLLHARVPLLGRFRKKRPVEQPRTINVGVPIPDIDVEVVQFSGDSSVSAPMSIREVLGGGSCVLVGESQPMPSFGIIVRNGQNSHTIYHDVVRHARSVYTSVLNRAYAWIFVVRFRV
jgi:hypothetical protein